MWKNVSTIDLTSMDLNVCNIIKVGSLPNILLYKKLLLQNKVL